MWVWVCNLTFAVRICDGLSWSHHVVFQSERLSTFEVMAIHLFVAKTLNWDIWCVLLLLPLTPQLPTFACLPFFSHSVEVRFLVHSLLFGYIAAVSVFIRCAQCYFGRAWNFHCVHHFDAYRLPPHQLVPSLWPRREACFFAKRELLIIRAKGNRLLLHFSKKANSPAVMSMHLSCFVLHFRAGKRKGGERKNDPAQICVRVCECARV